MTLRGIILEDSVATTGKHGTVRGLPLKEVLEQVVPELSVSCLRLALSTAKVTDQLLKLDEQGVSFPYLFICILFCLKAQTDTIFRPEKKLSSCCFFVVFLNNPSKNKGKVKLMTDKLVSSHGP